MYNDLEEIAERINKNYQPDSRDFIKYLRANDHVVFNEDPAKAVRLYQAWLKSRGLKPATIDKRLSGVKALVRKHFKMSDKKTDKLAWYELEEELREIKGFKRYSACIAQDKIISPEEVKTLIEKTTPKISLMIKFLYATGCRVSEMCNARYDWLTEQKSVYRLMIVGKGGKERPIFVSKDLILDIIQEFNGDTYLFETKSGKPQHRRNVYNYIRDAGHKFLNRNISPHKFRHSFATKMIEAHPEKIKDISNYLGHTGFSVTADMYLHNELSPEDLGLI